MTIHKTFFNQALTDAFNQGYSVNFIDDENRFKMANAKEAMDYVNESEYCALKFEHTEKPSFFISLTGLAGDFELQDYTDSDDHNHPINAIFGDWISYVS